MQLTEVRIHLYNLLELASTRLNTIYEEASEQDAVMCFIRQLKRMAEAASLRQSNEVRVGFSQEID